MVAAPLAFYCEVAMFSPELRFVMFVVGVIVVMAMVSVFVWVNDADHCD